jgi:hypothetical protein
MAERFSGLPGEHIQPHLARLYGLADTEDT